MRPDYSHIALEIILNDQAYRNAAEELARWRDREAEARRNIVRLENLVHQYDVKLHGLSKRINDAAWIKKGEQCSPSA